ncbi:hypothetical protein [Pseudoalteromonas xiamenensis]|uniref:hypothetical protein n=1 Tax=Pseudoalteromonas xiamenensis TaxID=882626 RepID=UPI0027E43ABF|nr:hypothetical protein [Pseudoalteromonas xiamenensis]WMN61330.1 hypothetical protein NI389_08115 [Pseudoalteromonas xiamenensis]
MQSNITPQLAIQALLSWGSDRNQAISLLLAGELERFLPIEVKVSDLRDVLARVMSQQLSLDELEVWANMLEARVEFDITDIEGEIYALANAEQMGELSLEKVQQLLDLLN